MRAVTLRRVSSSVAVGAAALLAAVAPASGQDSTSSASPPPAKPVPARKATPLEGLAAKSVAVLPARYVSYTDTSGWSKQLPATADLLAQFDSVLTDALRDRGLQSWQFADDITRSAKRNSSFVPDPHAIGALSLRFGHRAPRNELDEPLASQLRSLVALSDARVVMIPVELRTVNRGAKVVMQLRLAVLDARGSTLLWIGEVASAPASAWSDAVLADLAEQAAALVVPAS